MTILGQVSDTDIRLLKIFRSVVETGGYGAAELTLGLSSSALSRYMKDLETRLGTVLCRRGRAGFALTEAGERVYQASESLMVALDQFKQDVADTQQVVRGTLVIAVFDQTVDNPRAHIDKALGQLDRLAPEVRLEMHVAPLNQIEQGVLDGRYHIGISPDHRASTRLEYEHLFTEQMYLYCGMDHEYFAPAPLAAAPGTADLLRVKFAGLAYHSPNLLAAQALGLTRDALVYDQEAVAHLILSGRYLGFLPAHYAEQWTTDGQMRALLPDRFNYQPDYSAIWQKDSHSAALEIFLSALREAHGPH